MKESLENYRAQIDEIDRAILANIAKRVKICEEIGAFKREHDIPMMQPDRVKVVINNVVALGKSFNLREDFVKKLYHEIHMEVFELENQIIDKEHPTT